jgi:hypothetical protein
MDAHHTITRPSPLLYSANALVYTVGPVGPATVLVGTTKITMIVYRVYKLFE